MEILTAMAATTWPPQTQGATALSVFLSQPPLEMKLIGLNPTSVLATSSPTTEFDAAIVNFVAPEDRDLLHPSFPPRPLPVHYTLVATRDTDLPVPLSGNAPALLASSMETPASDGEADSSGAKLLGTSDAAYPWSNRVQPADVSNDGYVSPVDALMIINSLNTEGARSLPLGQSSQVAQPFYDVNRDGFISPIDALQVINYLNKPATVEHKAATLPSGDPAAALPMRPLGTPSIAKDVPRAEHPGGEVAGRLFDPFASGLFTPVAGADTVGASVKADVWSAPDRDWILGGFEPAITALADGLAGISDVHDDLRDRLFSAYDRPRPKSDL